MKKMIFGFLVAFALAGCGGDSAEQPASGPSEVAQPVQPASSKTVDPATVGTVRGVVRFEGVAPETKMISVKGNPECSVQHQGGSVPSEELAVNAGTVQNVFVYVKQGLEDYSFTAPSEPVTVGNKKCVYVPHVSGAMVGQSVNFLNEDSTLHNIHSYPKNSKGFNLGLPLVGMKQTKKFDKSEVMVPLKCDVHPWMLGYIGVLEHPYFSVSDGEGKFELKDLPPGEYVIEAWQEKLGAQTQTITLGPQETKEVEFTFRS